MRENGKSLAAAKTSIFYGVFWLILNFDRQETDKYNMLVFPTPRILVASLSRRSCRSSRRISSRRTSCPKKEIFHSQFDFYKIRIFKFIM